MPNVSAAERCDSRTASPSRRAYVAIGVSRRLLTRFGQKALVGKVLQHPDNVGQDRLAGCYVFGGELIGHIADAAHAVAELQHLDRNFVRRQHALRRQDHPDLPRLIEFQPRVPRQFRPARLADTDVAADSHRSLVSFGYEGPGRNMALDIGMI
jgi:hypothetical protein